MGRGARRRSRRASARSSRATAPQAILPYSYAGTMGMLGYGSMDRRFFHRLGASLLDRTICATAGTAGYRYTVGSAVGTRPRAVRRRAADPDLGHEHRSARTCTWCRSSTRRGRRGARVVLIDPLPDPHRPAGRRGAADPARHRRGAGAGDDARDLPRRADRRRLPRAPHARVRAAAASASPSTRPSGRPPRPACRPRRSSGWRASTRRRSRPRSGSTTGCSATRTAAWRCGRSPACRRWSAPGGTRAAGSCSRPRGSFRYNLRALERPDLIAAGPRTINMARLGEALAELSRPVKALFVYNSNPAAVAPEPGARARRACGARTCSRSCTSSS